jgi:hypothetical protein
MEQPALSHFREAGSATPNAVTATIRGPNAARLQHAQPTLGK